MILYVLTIFLVLALTSRINVDGINEVYLSKETSDAIKGIFILLIFASHFAQFVPAYTHPLDTMYWGVRMFLGQCVVALFLFYSGYGVVESFKEKGFTYIDSFPGRRILRTVLVYDLSSIIFWLVNLLRGKTYSVSHVIASFLAWDSFGNDNWYIFVIVCLYVFSWAAFRMYREDHVKAVAIVTVCSLLFCYFLIDQGKGPYWYNTMLCYPLGMWVSIIRVRAQEKLLTNKNWIRFFVLGIVVHLVAQKMRDSHFIWYEVTAMSFAICVVLLTMKCQIKSRILQYCGKHLMSLYLMHRLPMICLKNTKIGENIYVYFLVCVLLAFVLSVCFEKLLFFVEKVVLKLFNTLRGHQFLFEELVKRDFKKKYKRTVLGMAWSVLSPLLTLLVMRLVFTQFFGHSTPHYTTYLFCGNLIFCYFSESTSQGMSSLMDNAAIFTKVNVPKYLFLFSKNVQTLINFGLTLCVFFIFCVLDNITFTWKLICLLYPIGCLVLFNIGVGLILSALFVFFRDIQYLWSVFTQLLMYISAIFYTIDGYSDTIQNLFLLNPVYLFIRYFRKIVIETTIPTIWFHLLMAADVIIVLGIGCWIYKKYNHRFLYYV